MTDRAPALRAVIDELISTAFHNMAWYANNRIEADHGRLKTRLRPMRGLKRDQTARVITGHQPTLTAPFRPTRETPGQRVRTRFRHPHGATEDRRGIAARRGCEA